MEAGGQVSCPWFRNYPIAWPSNQAVIAFFSEDYKPPKAWPHCQRLYKWPADIKDLFMDDDFCLRRPYWIGDSLANWFRVLAATSVDDFVIQMDNFQCTSFLRIILIQRISSDLSVRCS